MNILHNQQKVFDLITDIAKKDKRIEAVLLNGSRANPNSLKDQFQDYDIIFATKYIDQIIKDKEWHKQFGDILIMQEPDFEPDKKQYDVYGYLMQFQDMTRIDLRLIRPGRILENIDDAYSKVLLDKTGNYQSFNFNKEEEMYVTKVAKQYEFDKIVNEIYWVSTYVIKGIARKDYMYAEYMLSNPVKTAYIKLIKQYILSESYLEEYNFGKVNQHILENEEINDSLIKISCNDSLESINENIKHIVEQTNELATKISMRHDIKYNKAEYEAVKFYMANVL
ncbi:aminoglycoside 6-adenylyltransferase [Staphylococcus felis]|uniref:aminoglycoside 6-adenylyltransferase n=1 Tax=Staphylococcus felis TaxID=46127 RepID=UPI0018E17038|nr:aminoglycoside 6-adenylyltransferase [Staphylococcus felis]QQB03506.1 aminoglycoside 6-adenylyltransferase [Staphylococcus felis]